MLEIALTGMGSVVHRDHHPFAARPLPGVGDEGIPGPVLVPGRLAAHPLPFPASHDGVSEDREQPVVELLDLLVRRLLWPANEMRGDPPLPPFELPLVEEAQAGHEVGDHRGRPVSERMERGGSAGFVVVLQEARELRLVGRRRPEVLAHRPGVPLAQPVVEALVVGVVEPLLLEGPLQVPVHLGHETEARSPFPHARYRHRPERRRLPAPGALEHLGQGEHRHVAAHAVALAGDLQQFPDHGFLRGGVAVVELQGVRPAGEVRIAAMGQEQVPLLPLDPGVVLRLPAQALLRPRDKVLRVALHPGVIQPHVIRDEVEHQLQAAPREPLAQPRQRRVASEVGRDGIGGDRESGAADVRLAQVRQRLLEFPPPLAVLARHPPAGLARTPHAQQPDPVEARAAPAVQLGVRNVVERGRPPQRTGQLRQPDARVDLVERWMCRRGHAFRLA